MDCKKSSDDRHPGTSDDWRNQYWPLPAPPQYTDKKGKSGAKTDDYVPIGGIMVAVYKNSSYKNINTVKYQDSTHNGITMSKDFDVGKEYRIDIDTQHYEVQDFDTSGRQTTLILKRIDLYG